MKIVLDDEKGTYPKTTKSVGAAPKQYKQTIAPPLDEDEEVEDDEADKKLKEKIFVVTEGVDENDHVGDVEESDEPTTSEVHEDDSTEAPEEEEAGEDFDPGDFAGESEEFLSLIHI